MPKKQPGSNLPATGDTASAASLPGAALEAVAQVAELGEHAQLVLTLGQYLWAYITNKKYPFSEQDRESYDRLVALYKICNPLTDIPLQWTLDKDGAPEYSNNFHDLVKEIEARIATLEHCSHLLKSQIIAIVSVIAGFFDSIQKRSGLAELGRKVQGGGKYRCDGFEQMFFTELAIWVGSTLPLLSPHEQATLEEVDRRLAYCQDVDTRVLRYRKDESIPNAKNQLEVIMTQLRGVRASLLSCYQATHFNQAVECIGNQFSTMVADTFKVLHWISDADCARYPVVKGYLDPVLPDREKVVGHLNTLMAQWMVQTFKTAGIEQDDFKPTNPVDLKSLSTHLEVDLAQIKPAQLKNEKFTGLPTFACATPVMAKMHLERVREIHRSVLEIAHVRSSLATMALVVQTYGEVWLYGDAEGQLVLAAFLKVLLHASTQHMRIISEFWSDFYGDETLASPAKTSYLAHCKEHHLDVSHKNNEHLTAANEAFKRMVKAHQTIQETTRIIQDSTTSFAVHERVVREKKRQLIADLHQYMSTFMPTVSPHELDGLAALLTPNNPPSPAMRRIPAAEPLASADAALMPVTSPVSMSVEPTPDANQLSKAVVWVLSPASAQTYSRLRACLAQQAIGHPPTLDLVPMPQPPNFHSPLQKEVYTKFLAPYASIVDAWILWSILFSRYGLNGAEMRLLRERYSAINAAFKILYRATASSTGDSDDVNFAEKIETDLVDALLMDGMSHIIDNFPNRKKAVEMRPCVVQEWEVSEENGHFEIKGLVAASSQAAQSAQAVSAEQFERLNQQLAEMSQHLEHERVRANKYQESERTLREENQKLEQEKHKQKLDISRLEKLLAKQKQAATATDLPVLPPVAVAADTELTVPEVQANQAAIAIAADEPSPALPADTTTVKTTPEPQLASTARSSEKKKSSGFRLFSSRGSKEPKKTQGSNETKKPEPSDATAASTHATIEHTA